MYNHLEQYTFKTMDTVFIKNLILSGKHGVYSDERKHEQEFVVDIQLYTDLKKPGETGGIQDTVDYSKVKKIAEEIVQNSTEYLIEKLASRIASKILNAYKSIEKVSVSIQKTEIWKNGTPGVTIVRTQNEN